MSFKKVVGWIEVIFGLIIFSGIFYCFTNPSAFSERILHFDVGNMSGLSEISETGIRYLGNIILTGGFYLILIGIFLLIISIVMALQGILNIDEADKRKEVYYK